MHSGMLVLLEGMLAASKDNLLLNEGNLVARQRRMHVPDNGVLILSKEIVHASKRDCLGKCRWCLPQTKQPFHQTRGHPHVTQYTMLGQGKGMLVRSKGISFLA